MPPADQIPAAVAIPIAPTDGIITGSSSGWLEYRKGCLYLNREGPRGPIRLLPIWSPGTRFNGRVIVPAQEGTPVVFRLGQQVRIEGSAPDWAPYLTKTYPDLVPWRNRCGERPIFVVAIRSDA